MKVDKKLMRQKVLDFIKGGGALGKTFSEIQRFIVEDLHGYNYDEMSEGYDWKSNSYKPARMYRGYWCTNLLGTRHYDKFQVRRGILPMYCKKVNGQWVHNDYAK